MSITYRLKKDIVSRIAANLIFDISKVKTMYIIKGDRCFNGKSLVGILSNNLRFNDIITIKVDESDDMKIIEKVFSDLGEVIN